MKIIRRRCSAESVLDYIAYRHPGEPLLNGRAAMDSAVRELARGRLRRFAQIADSTVFRTARSRWFFQDGSAIEGDPHNGWEAYTPVETGEAAVPPEHRPEDPDLVRERELAETGAEQLLRSATTLYLLSHHLSERRQEEVRIACATLVDQIAGVPTA